MQTICYLIDQTPLLIVLIGAVFVHVCFQLSVSVLTLLSSHTIGRRLPNTRLLSLSFWYILGVGSMVGLLALSAISAERLLLAHDRTFAVIVSFTVAPLIALLTILFYYRRGRGTRLWLPRPAAEYITERAKKTRSSVEAFALGATTALTELPFAIAPLAMVGFVTQGIASERWLALSVLYALAVCAPLAFVAFYISSGHAVSSVQRWREQSKDYLKWTSAIALILLTVYVAVLQIGGQS